MRKILASKIIGLVLSVYLALFFAFVIPLHHHADFTEHDDCAICAVSHNPFTSNVNVNLQILFVLLFTIVFTDTAVNIFRKTQIHLRSPPVF